MTRPHAWREFLTTPWEATTDDLLGIKPVTPGTEPALEEDMQEMVAFEIDDLTFEVKCLAYTPAPKDGSGGAEIDVAPLVRMTGPGVDPQAAISWGDFLLRYAKANDLTLEAADHEILEEVQIWVEEAIEDNDLDEPEYYAEDEDEPWFDNGGD